MVMWSGSLNSARSVVASHRTLAIRDGPIPGHHCRVNSIVADTVVADTVLGHLLIHVCEHRVL
jgi:hypothetical protein